MLGERWGERFPSNNGVSQALKVILRLNPSQSKAATDAGSSRNTTTTFWEVVKFRKNHVSK
jgi:hypothetical protein